MAASAVPATPEVHKSTDPMAMPQHNKQYHPCLVTEQGPLHPVPTDVQRTFNATYFFTCTVPSPKQTRNQHLRWLSPPVGPKQPALAAAAVPAVALPPEEGG